MKLSDARLLAIGDRVLVHCAGKKREGWIVYIDRNPSSGVWNTYWIASLGYRETCGVFPRGIIRRVTP